jgi:hypothetical protein
MLRGPDDPQQPCRPHGCIRAWEHQPSDRVAISTRLSRVSGLSTTSFGMSGRRLNRGSGTVVGPMFLEQRTFRGLDPMRRDVSQADHRLSRAEARRCLLRTFREAHVLAPRCLLRTFREAHVLAPRWISRSPTQNSFLRYVSVGRKSIGNQKKIIMFLTETLSKL